MRSILAKSLLGTIADQLAEKGDRALLLLSVRAIEDDVRDVPKFSSGYAERREEIEAIFLVARDYNVVDDARVFSASRSDWREEEMGSVGEPVQPLELAENRDAAADLNSRVELVIVWNIFRKPKLVTWDFGERFLDEIQLALDGIRISILCAVKYPRAVSKR